MPKILLGVSSSYCASFLKGQVSFLVKQGFDVIIISGPGDAIRTLASTEGARLYELDFSKKISPLADLLLLVQIIRILRKEKPDVVNAGNPKSGFLTMLACWLTRTRKRVFTMHGLLSDTQIGLKRFIISFTERISCRIANRVIVVSPSLRQHAEHRKVLKPGKGVVIEKGSCNGVDTNYFSPVQNEFKEDFREKMKMKNGFTIGFVGRISRDKGVDILLNSFIALKKKNPLIQLLIVGPLEEETTGIAEIEKLMAATDDVYITGMLSDVRPAYCFMDVLVLPSLREGLPNVVLEASAMCIPVITSDIPGCRDALINRVTGALFDSGQVDSLVGVLEEMMESETMRLQYGMNGRKFVQDNFQQQKIWTGQWHLYQQL